MSLRRFFVESLPEDRDISIGGEDAHHLLTVSRSKIGERIIVCDGSGYEAECELVSADGKTASARILKKYKSPGEPGAALWLYPSISKGERFEWMLQKSVELGAAGIIPVLSERCVAATPDIKKLHRWRKITREAAQQSGRGIIPEIMEAVSFREALKSAAGTRVFCYEDEGRLLLSELLRESPPGELSLMTGPEGGYSPGEAELAKELGWTPVSLGSRILRCETAPPAALAAILAIWGEL